MRHPAPELDAEPTWFERQIKERIVVHTTANHSIEGLLIEIGNEGVILKVAKMLGSNGPTDLAGEVYIPREQVAFAQLPG